jgi:hypothetical protein
MVVHAYNPGYSGSRDRRIEVRGLPGQKLVRFYPKKEAWHHGALL